MVINQAPQATTKSNWQEALYWQEGLPAGRSKA